jgi:putative transposase
VRLGQATPAAYYTPSPRPMPDRLPPREYPDRFEVRYVSATGGIRWHTWWMNLSIVCVGEYVGLEEIDDGIWNAYFGPLRLGRLLERRMRIEDDYARTLSSWTCVTHVPGLLVTYLPDRLHRCI